MSLLIPHEIKAALCPCNRSPARPIFLMASSKTLDDDEYVAKLLAEDAKKSSLRYAQHGLSALLPRRPTANAPKPNTRFLKAIVREADSHNVALKKKEELEARIRQRELSERNRRDPAQSIYENEHPRKRRRYSEDKHRREDRRPREDMISHGRLNKNSERSTSRERRHHRVGRVRNGERLEGRSQILHQQDRKRHRSRSRSEPRSVDRRDQDQIIQRARAEEKVHKRRRHGSQSTLSANFRDQQKPNSTTRDHPNSRHCAPSEREESEDDRQTTQDAYESDPLEMLVGPLERPKEKALATEKPPVRSKGRGAYRTSSAAMDAHFSSDYNPGLDLHPESELEDEKDDWDMALEALRDREMFKQKYVERLREAGFDDAEIKKWEDSGKEKDVADVKWAAKGEAREWDLGKEDQD